MVNLFNLKVQQIKHEQKGVYQCLNKKNAASVEEKRMSIAVASSLALCAPLKKYTKGRKLKLCVSLFVQTTLISAVLFVLLLCLTMAPDADTFMSNLLGRS